MKISTNITVTRSEYLTVVATAKRIEALVGIEGCDHRLNAFEIKSTSKFSTALFAVGLKDNIELTLTVNLTKEYLETSIAAYENILTQLVPLVKAINGIMSSDVLDSIKGSIDTVLEGLEPTKLTVKKEKVTVTEKED